MSQGEEGGRFLLCRIGSCIGALALRDVRETMRPLPIAPLAGLPPFVLGLAVVRGSSIPVIHAGQLLGSSSSLPGRFVALTLGERAAALAVDAVLEIRSLPQGVLTLTAPLLRDANAGLVSLVGALDRQLLVVLQTARLVPESVWSALEPAPASP